MPTAPLRSADPRQLGRYRLIGRLGEGGMGAVYLGVGPDQRQVAVKVIRPELADQDHFRGRFRSEVNQARSVPPFCTAAVLDADTEHSTPYLVAEFVDGPSLAEVVADRGPLTGGDLYSVAVGVATALAAIHGAGVIHRDLKPRNVLFSLGTPKVIDFGIARAFEATSNHTRTDQMVGTVAYMAPERFDTDGAGVGPAADIFAWGAVVTYAGTGRTPFHADSPAATAARILTQPPQLGALPSPLREIVERTLAKEPADRPTATDLLDLLLDTGSHSIAELTGRPTLQEAAQAMRAGHSHRARTRRRRPAAIVAGVVAVAALCGAGAGLWARGSTEPEKVAATSSPAPTTSARPPIRVGDGPRIIDPLDRPAQWRATKDEFGSCRFSGGALVVTSTGESNYCPGPADKLAGDQSIAVTVALREAGSCADVGFRMIDDGYGYSLMLCPRSVVFWKNELDTAGPFRTQPADIFRDERPHRVELVIRDEVATAIVDGKPLVTADLEDRFLRSGSVRLGVTAEDPSRASGAAFRDIEMRTL